MKFERMRVWLNSERGTGVAGLDQVSLDPEVETARRDAVAALLKNDRDAYRLAAKRLRAMGVRSVPLLASGTLTVRRDDG